MRELLGRCPRRVLPSLRGLARLWLRDKTVRYGLCCLSVLLCLGQLARPDLRIIRVEAATMASCCGSLMNAITPVALTSLRICWSTMSVRLGAGSFRAGSLRLALRSAELDSFRDLIDQAASAGAALLVPRTPALLDRCSLTFILALARPEPLVGRYFLAAKAPGNLCMTAPASLPHPRVQRGRQGD